MAWKTPHDVFKLDLTNINSPDVDLYGSIQARLREVGDVASTLAQALWGKEAANFMDSTPGNDQMDDSWQPKRALGRGGFGVVGLWQKIDWKGCVADEIAIKETAPREDNDNHLDRDHNMPREAVIMKQLNDVQDERAKKDEWRTKNILRLRSFKNLSPHRRWRFYLEFAPYGDLFQLTYLYRAWDTYFPEDFLWHVFYSLAKAGVIMDEGPFTDPESEEPVENGLVVHLDIKLENIYLSKPDRDTFFRSYPVIKVADFGLSDMTHQGDERNPAYFRRRGTEGSMPPVSILSYLNQ
jgi:serine/threonine protein kinase